MSIVSLIYSVSGKGKNRLLEIELSSFSFVADISTVAGLEGLEIAFLYCVLNFVLGIEQSTYLKPEGIFA